LSSEWIDVAGILRGRAVGGRMARRQLLLVRRLTLVTVVVVTLAFLRYVGLLGGPMPTY